MSSPATSPSPRDSDLAERHTSGAPSTAASSPPTHPSSPTNASSSRATSEAIDDVEVFEDEETRAKAVELALDEQETEKRLARLQSVLERSAVFSSILKSRMDEEKARQAAIHAQRNEIKKRGRPPKRKKEAEVDKDEEQEPPAFMQPSLITGATLKQYQLEGLQWMVSLDQNGISGILADEMGLGKTLQTIAFSAYLREHGNFKPFLVVCPLSVVHNWADEYQKFAPGIPTCIYHGSPEERAELRRTVMAIPGKKQTHRAPQAKSKSGRAKARKAARASRAAAAADDDDDDYGHAAKKARTGPAKAQRRKSTVVIDSDDEDAAPAGADAGYTAAFPIVLTTYDMIIRDRRHLQHYNWGYIVVDEGHRLKNLNCKLMQEIKKFPSAGRMILTGTPLHNNLAELWSLLNFILPDIFDDLDTFQEWFNLPELQSALPTSQSTQIIASLHAILKPFLLRRVKADVEQGLPPKKEYVLYAPLSVRQREAYDYVVSGSLRQWLIEGGAGGQAGAGTLEAEVEEEGMEVEGEEKRRVSRRAGKPRQGYAEESADDDEYFGMLERRRDEEKEKEKAAVEESAEAQIGREYHRRNKVRQVNNMKLQNMVMQLRKVCSHPFLFDWPVDPNTMDPVLGEELLNASGKMMVLDRLLQELFRRKHKVLLFSQFTTMLDIIEAWAVDHMGWKICRIDGSTKPMDRREQMNIFQTGGDDPEAPKLFLLSTRAGGLGINLVAADTVIFYDQDWNPQMDAQAQDRAHRIGQTKPVLIFRLVSAHTVETKIMQRANDKRRLEALVIAKGKFKMPAGGAAAPAAKRETMAETAAALLRLEGEKIEVVPATTAGKQSVLSDEDLDVLLDRRPEVFAERGLGWTSGRRERVVGEGAEAGAAVEGGRKAAFAVYDAPLDEGNDALAKMMEEEEEVV
ncbi:SNF2 family DNA-dependent ATPase [Pholiota molesta]|nr:SNF2 family DNA-dependent ATPase [Pholiota molesta]